MGNTLYLECGSGISGDMTVAALLDLGADQQVLKNALASLPVDGYEIAITRVKKAGLDACDFNVKLDHAHDNHDHDMEYLHGHSYSGHAAEDDIDHYSEHQKSNGEHHSDHQEADGEHHHEADGEHHHGANGEHHHGANGEHHHEADGEHHHGANEEHHPHTHRGMPEIRSIIGQAELTDRARALALRVFDVLAEAEAKAHGVPLEQVHFHEVGAVDSIVDIVAAAVCLDNLAITEVIIPQLSEGRGFVRCQHGVIPVPVPAVLNIAQAHHLTLHLTETEGELVTPTGAAIAAAIRTSDHLPEQFQVERVGIGAGKRAYERPSLLRAMLIQAASEKQEKNDAEDTDTIVCLESNIDDSTGEALGYCMERLLAEGARDVWYTPVYMKKNRPAWLLSVICGKEQIRKLEQVIFAETTTIGIRRKELARTILPRSEQTIRTALGPVQVKVCTLPDGEIRIYPEYDSVKKLADEQQVSFQQAFILVQQSIDKERLEKQG